MFVVVNCSANIPQCDEVHPLCGNCEKHGVECDFGGSVTQPTPLLRRESSDTSSVVRYSLHSPSTSSYTSLTSSVMPVYGSPTASLDSGVLSNYSGTSRMLELRLLHNFTAMTAKTLAATDTADMEHAWMVSVPGMAFEAPCLMDALFAVSALHLRALNPDDQSLVRASHGYMASAISQYSAALMSGVEASNAEALFTTSAVIAFQASASRRFLDEVYGPGNSYTLPLPWFHSFQGVKAVVLATWKHIRVSERVRPIITAQPALTLDLNPERPAFFGPLLEDLDEELEKMEESKRAETRQAYEHAVAFLNWCHQKPERARILGFPATVSRRFVELIEQHAPRALVTIACFFAMTKVVDQIWWLEGIAKREVMGIMTLLPRQWWNKLDWAILVANHEGPMDEETWGDCWHTDGTPEEEKGFNGDVHSHIDILVDMNPSMPYGV